MLGRNTAPVVLGRNTALAEVATFVDAMEVAPAALLLEGDPGIGKTTVWRSAQAAAVAHGHRVLAVTAVEGEADLPFVALRDLFESVDLDTALTLPPPQRAALDVALLRSADPRAVADQHAVCVAALGIIRTMAAERPLVIAVDDAGWLDRSSDRVLRYVIRRLAAEPVGVLAARRPGPVAPLGLDGPPLGARLHRVALGPLDPDAIHTLLTEHFGLQLPRRLTRRIHAACGGNPFSAVEIGRTLSARGERIVDENALPLPGGVLRVTAERIAGLSPAAQQALAVVAVSTGASPALLTAALGDDAVDALDEAVGEGLLQVDGSAVRFAHPLMRSAAAANLTVRERRRMHARLATLVGDPDECAVHLAAATVGPDESVAATVESAARRAFLRGAPDVAAVLAARAVALTPPEAGSALIRRRISIGEYRYHAEDMDAARTALSELVAELPPGELRAEALLWLACVRKAQNGMAEAAELARAALAQAERNTLRAAAERLLAQALVFVGAVSSAHRHAAAALGIARSIGDRSSIAESEATLAWTRFWVGRGVRIDLLDAARSSPAWSCYAPQEATPDIMAGILLCWSDQVTPARAMLLAEDRRLTELGQDRPRALVQYTLAELECRAGDLAAALRHVEEGLAAAELVGDEFHRSLLICTRGLIAARRGCHDDARADAERAAPLGVEIGTTVTSSFAASLLGFVALSAGDAATAHRHLGPVCAKLPAGGAFDPGYARFVPDGVEALVALGRTDEARQVLAPFAERATALDRPWALGATGRCRALLHAAAGELDAAQETVELALAAHDRAPLPFERARTMLVAGSVRRRLRRRREARAALEEAQAEFIRLEAVVWADKAGAELSRIGGRTGSPLELTDAERRIAEQVAAGLSNKEVAAALFLSVSTVEAALWKVYRKLDVRSRTQLAARLAERRG
jgi:DNA-binding CsgD family transcriptional regulator